MSNGNGVEDGGVCCIGTTCEPSSQATCQQAGGDYNRSSPVGVCFVTQMILDYLNDEHGKDLVVRLMAGGTYSLLFDVRDQILTRWSVGEKALGLYRKHGDEVLEMTRRDRELRRHVLFTFFKLAAFSRSLLRYTWSGKAEPESKGRYTLGLHKELVALMYRLDASGASRETVQAYESILTDVKPLVNVSVPELLQKLGVGAGADRESES